MDENEVKVNVIETDERPEDEIIAELAEEAVEVQDEGEDLEKVEE